MVYSDHALLKNIFIKGDSEKAQISGCLDRLGEFALKLIYRPSTDQHIGIAERLSRMCTRMLTVSRDWLGERMSMASSGKISGEWGFCFKAPEIQRISFLRGCGDYLERGPLSLEGLPRNRQRQIVRKAKKYRLSSPNEVPNLRYLENNGSFSLCIVESEIEKFLSMPHEDHGHYSLELSLSFLVGRVYWPSRVKDVNGVADHVTDVSWRQRNLSRVMHSP